MLSGGADRAVAAKFGGQAEQAFPGSPSRCCLVASIQWGFEQTPSAAAKPRFLKDEISCQ